MCGIFGHYTCGVPRTKREIAAILTDGLRRLEYRGYDSAGICVDASPAPPSGPDDGTLPLPEFDIVKTVGDVADLEAAVGAFLDAADGSGDVVFETHAGIAHTRWATHGRPCAENAHPHSSSDLDEFVVVHNGVITNHDAIRAFLATRGVGAADFASETDTEVIPKLMKHIHDEVAGAVSFPQLVSDTMSHVLGAYAVLVKSRHFPGELVAARRGSPIVFGVSERANDGAFECFVSSDPGAIVEHSARAVTLENGDVAHAFATGFSIYNASPDGGGEGGGEGRALPALAVVQRASRLLELALSDVSKGAYDTFMAKEIHEQPSSLEQTTAGRVPARGSGGSRVKLGGLPLERVVGVLASRRIVLVACGTSYNAALSTRAFLERMAGVPVGLELASDFVDREPAVFRDDVFVFVSQSGETADTLSALDHARSRGAICVGVTNVAGSTLARLTDFGIHVNAGPEIGVASTKAFTSQIAALVMIALALAGDRESLAGERLAVCAALRDLPGACAATLALGDQMKRMAARIVDEPSMLVIGRGANYAVALEGALKTKEVALIHAEGILAGELKHGPLALVGDAMPIVVGAPRDEMHSRMLSVTEQLNSRDCASKLFVICERGDRSFDAFEARGVELIRVPSAGHPCLNPILNVVPFQLLAYHLAVARGHDVDRPRNLAKSVTVSD